MFDLERISAELIIQMTERMLTLGTAESLTGGLIAATVASVSGASQVFMGGIVSYDPRIKRELLHVSQKIIDTVGVVSETCASQMADGARLALSVDIAVSATGVAGPTGGTEDLPVGTVFLGVSTAKGTRVERCQFDGDRQSVREQSVQRALELALEAVNKLNF